MRLQVETFFSFLGLLSYKDDVNPKLLRMEHEDKQFLPCFEPWLDSAIA